MHWTAKDMRQSRPYTTALLNAVDEGVADKDTLIRDLLGWMSEADVKEFVQRNDLLELVRIVDDPESSDEEPMHDEPGIDPYLQTR